MVRDQRVEPFLMKDQRHFIGALHIFGRDDFVFLHVTEQRDLFFHFRRQIAIGAAEQNMGLDTDLPQLIDAVLRRLGLQFARSADIGDERQVDVEHIVAADVVRNLANRLQKRQAFDVADRPSDLANDDVGIVRHRRMLCLISSVICGTT